MLRIARNSVNGRLNRNTFCSGAEVAPVQCKRGLKVLMVDTDLIPAEKLSFSFVPERKTLFTYWLNLNASGSTARFISGIGRISNKQFTKVFWSKPIS